MSLSSFSDGWRASVSCRVSYTCRSISTISSSALYTVAFKAILGTMDETFPAVKLRVAVGRKRRWDVYWQGARLGQNPDSLVLGAERLRIRSPGF